MQGSARKDVVFGAARVYTVAVPGPKWKSWIRTYVLMSRYALLRGKQLKRLLAKALFYLQHVSGGKSLTSENTLAVVKTSVIDDLRLSAGLLRTITEVRGKRLTYLSKHRLTTLATLCLANEVEGLPGIMIEAGCALGGGRPL